jgi:hypothetical protein
MGVRQKLAPGAFRAEAAGGSIRACDVTDRLFLAW